MKPGFLFALSKLGLEPLEKQRAVAIDPSREGG